MKQNKYRWLALDGDEYSLMDDAGGEIVISPAGDGYVANMGSVKIVKEPMLPLNTCFKQCKRFAEKYLSIQYSDDAWLKEAQHQNLLSLC